MLGLLLPLLVCEVAFASDDEANQNWQFDLTPYLWLPTISGDVNYTPSPGGGGRPGVGVGATDWLDLLNGAALLSGGARKGPFSIRADYVYLGLKSEHDTVVAVRDDVLLPVASSLNVATETRFDGSSWTLAAGYAIRQNGNNFIELLGGVRYLGLDLRTSWNLSLDITAPGGGVVLPATGSIGEDAELWDGIVGVRGRAQIGDSRWSMPYYLDVGTGSSDLTWQALAGFSYRYGWGELLLLYRHLDYDEGSDRLLEGLSLTGPTIGVRFRF